MGADLATLRAAVAAAEDELYRVEQADDFAHVNGSYLRALTCVRKARQALNDALVGNIAAQAAEIAAGSQALLNAARIATADTTSQGASA